jgi:hypothetical protein
MHHLEFHNDGSHNAAQGNHANFVGMFMVPAAGAGQQPQAIA